MTKVYFIRHGETEWNKTGRFQGWSDIPLSEVGMAQADALGKRFKREKIPVDVIYASPLIRAQQTASPIATLYQLPVNLVEGFKELNFDYWDGSTFEELREKYGREFIDFVKAPHLHTFPGDGSFENVITRLQPGLDEVLSEKNKDKSIVVVSHGGIIRLMLFHLMGMDFGLYNHMWIDNTGISLYEIWDNGRKVLRTVNDHSHLFGV